MLKVDILTKESCGGIPSYDHFITIVLFLREDASRLESIRLPRYDLQNYFKHSVPGFSFFISRYVYS